MKHGYVTKGIQKSEEEACVWDNQDALNFTTKERVKVIPQTEMKRYNNKSSSEDIVGKNEKRPRSTAALTYGLKDERNEDDQNNDGENKTTWDSQEQALTTQPYTAHADHDGYIIFFERNSCPQHAGTYLRITLYMFHVHGVPA